MHQTCGTTPSPLCPPTLTGPAGLFSDRAASPLPCDKRADAYLALIMHLNARELRLSVDELTPTEQLCIFAVDLHGQVQNGGFAQWNENGYLKVARETVAALRTIGATEAAQLLVLAVRAMRKAEAVAVAVAEEFALVERDNAAERVRQKLEAKLDALDAAYYALPTRTDRYILAYVQAALRENPDALPGFPPA